ncbi:hypothetical protein HUT16_13320 [Kitasatospora sp. NA04385]|uniref:hypothetical protein n=1 Tax=Kitasatospora sp. NA04385 TaxID=2742135 RepID=UPI001592727B|nr:hypothetical protein [Kitasatospora sp. NA04385]QKW19908.1 hypothetical protein HUT16_13320 [Kitasatospora sp. NA04385]
MIPVEYYPKGHPGLDWHAVGDDLDGVVLASSPRGVAVARATDPRTVLYLNPDEWADLRDAIKQGHCDHLLGDRTLCADPTPRDLRLPGERVYVVLVERTGAEPADPDDVAARLSDLLRRGAYRTVPALPH